VVPGDGSSSLSAHTRPRSSRELSWSYLRSELSIGVCNEICLLIVSFRSSRRTAAEPSSLPHPSRVFYWGVATPTGGCCGGETHGGERVPVAVSGLATLPTRAQSRHDRESCGDGRKLGSTLAPRRFYVLVGFSVLCSSDSGLHEYRTTPGRLNSPTERHAGPTHTLARGKGTRDRGRAGKLRADLRRRFWL
jgi:hypothetical protein